MKKTAFAALAFFALFLVSCSSKEDKKQRSEEEGNILVETKARFIKGIGDGLKGEGKDAAESISEGAGEVYNGLNTGFDASLVKVNVKLDPRLEPFLSLGRCGKSTNDSTRRSNLVIYGIFKQDYNGKLLVRALDKDNLEVGRATQTVNRKTDDAEYLEFEFDKRTPINLVEYFTLEKR